MSSFLELFSKKKKAFVHMDVVSTYWIRELCKDINSLENEW